MEMGVGVAGGTVAVGGSRVGVGGNGVSVDGGTVVAWGEPGEGAGDLSSGGEFGRDSHAISRAIARGDKAASR